MILVDTSVWVDFFRQKNGSHTDYLKACVEQEEDLCYNGIILTEILQGLKNRNDSKRVFGVLNNLIFLPMPYRGYIAAAELYREARKKGKTIRNTTDCLIAACAIHHKAELLHNDKDFAIIDKISDLTTSDL